MPASMTLRTKSSGNRVGLYVTQGPLGVHGFEQPDLIRHRPHLLSFIAVKLIGSGKYSSEYLGLNYDFRSYQLPGHGKSG